MTSAQFARRAFALLGKVALSIVILGVIGVQFYVFSGMDSDSFWLEFFMMFSVAWKFFLFLGIWEKAEEPVYNEG